MYRFKMEFDEIWLRITPLRTVEFVDDSNDAHAMTRAEISIVAKDDDEDWYIDEVFFESRRLRGAMFHVAVDHFSHKYADQIRERIREELPDLKADALYDARYGGR